MLRAILGIVFFIASVTLIMLTPAPNEEMERSDVIGMERAPQQPVEQLPGMISRN